MTIRAGKAALANFGVEKFNTAEFSQTSPMRWGCGQRGVVSLRVVEETNQYFKQTHEHSFHAGNASGRVLEKSRKSICTEFLVGQTGAGAPPKSHGRCVQ